MAGERGCMEDEDEDEDEDEEAKREMGSVDRPLATSDQKRRK
jgi:hypothetical protein